MKPKYRNCFLCPSLLAHFVVCVTTFSSSAIAGDVFWDGSADTNWNNADNWSENRVPIKADFSDNAIINTLTNFPVITADLAAIPNEIKIGTGGGNTGRLDHRAGSAVVGAGGWSAIGEFGGNGTYNLADTAASGGTLTGFGTGSGSYSTQRLYVSREGTGEMAVNTSGSVKVFNDMYVGEGGTGMLKWDAGTLNRNGDGGWMVIGRDGGGKDGNGTFNISGGTINAANDTIVGLDSGSIGNLNQTGGTYNAGGMWVGRSGGTGTWTVAGASTQLTSTGEVYVGGGAGSNGTLQVSAGTVALNNWVNVGRDGGTGTLGMTGGTMTVERALRIGFGSGGNGTLTLSGGAQINAATVSETITIGGNAGNGTATVTGAGTLLKSVREFYVGNGDNSVGQLTATGGTVESASWFGIGRDGATGTLTISGNGIVSQGTTDNGSRLQMTNNNKPSTATIHLNGGTLITNGIENGANGTTNVFLNGGLLQARVNNLTFLQGMTSVTVKAGGAKIDSNGVSITINQAMVGEAGDGGLTKSGPGSLRLTGNNSYTGPTTVSQGTLVINGNQSLATGVVNISNAGTRLTGNGTVGGATTISAGALHSPGSTGGVAVGNQNFISSLSYANGSIFAWDIDDNSTATGFDTAVVTGALNGSTAGDTSIFRVVFGTNAKSGINDPGNLFWNTPGESRVWSMTSLFGKNFTSGLFTSVETYDSVGVFDVSSKGAFTINGSSLTWSAVPEPSSALAGLLIAAGLLRRRRG